MQILRALRRQIDRLGGRPQATAGRRKAATAEPGAAASLQNATADTYVVKGRAKAALEVPRSAAPVSAMREPSINWHGDVEVKRSRFGVHGGARFLTDGSTMMVAKWAPTLEHEILAYHLAAHLGLPTPFLRVESRPAKQLRALLGSGDAPVMLMRHLPGHSFAELVAQDEKHIKGSQGPQGPLHDLGRLAAFDYLLQNQDRFPLEGLEGNNPGNLMLSAGKVHGIDHTLPRLVADVETQRYRKTLATALKLLRDPAHAEAEACLRGLVDFFPKHWGLSWEAIRGDVVAGFVQQAHRIGRMSDAELRRLFQVTKKHKPLKRDLEDLLIGHLGIFRDASVAGGAL
ncbi:MAG: hypothetical protein EOO40_04385 [Deltaproteobacteria bacterium]|nr:MAG: hypothetical protein EOO40_04385 [Deltaproteobacteria bacterium]